MREEIFVRDQTMRVGNRTDQEHLVFMRFSSEPEAKSVWHVLDGLHRGGKLDPKSCVVVFALRELLVSLPASSDVEAQIQAIQDACRAQCELNIRRRDMAVADYDMYALALRAARSQSN